MCDAEGVSRNPWKDHQQRSITDECVGTAESVVTLVRSTCLALGRDVPMPGGNKPPQRQCRKRCS